MYWLGSNFMFSYLWRRACDWIWNMWWWIKWWKWMLSRMLRYQPSIHMYRRISYHCNNMYTNMWGWICSSSREMRCWSLARMLTWLLRSYRRVELFWRIWNFSWYMLNVEFNYFHIKFITSLVSLNSFKCSYLCSICSSNNFLIEQSCNNGSIFVSVIWCKSIDSIYDLHRKCDQLLNPQLS